MNLGRLLEVGAPRDLYARPATRFVATFLGAANLLLAQQSAEGLRFGSTPLDAALRQPLPVGREHEVVTLLRPEEIELASDREQLGSSYIARATVEEMQFTGALERLRLKLLDNQHALQNIGGNGEARMEVTRAQPERRALPLAVGDTVTLGARRMHVLPTPLSSFAIHCTDTEAAQGLAQAPLLATLAARMKTRVATCGESRRAWRSLQPAPRHPIAPRNCCAPAPMKC
jgi:hypothetical protein